MHSGIVRRFGRWHLNGRRGPGPLTESTFFLVLAQKRNGFTRNYSFIFLSGEAHSDRMSMAVDIDLEEEELAQPSSARRPAASSRVLKRNQACLPCRRRKMVSENKAHSQLLVISFSVRESHRREKLTGGRKKRNVTPRDLTVHPAHGSTKPHSPRNAGARARSIACTKKSW